MIQGRKIVLTVEGQKVEGEIVHLLPNDIRVKITAPFAGETNDLHVPHFMMGYEQNRLSDRTGQITPRGIEKAERLLAEIYIQHKAKERQ